MEKLYFLALILGIIIITLIFLIGLLYACGLKDRILQHIIDFVKIFAIISLINITLIGFLNFIYQF